MLAGLLFAANVGGAGRIVADQDGDQMRHDAGSLAELGHLRSDFGLYLRGNGLAVNNSGGHGEVSFIRPAEPTAERARP